MKKFTTLTFVCFAVMLILAVLPANAIKQVSSFESHGPLENATEKGIGHIFSYTANDLPMFYLDLDEVDFDPATHGERLNLTLGPKDVDELDENGIVYESYAWEDVRGRTNIAWLGDKYLAVGEDVTKLSKYLVDFESDEKLTLRQGETWDLGEGFTIYVQDVDIEGRKVWMVMEQDGSPIADIIAQDDEYGYYNETVAGESDVEVAVIHVDKVFAGMTANMAVIDDAEVISIDVTELDEDEYFGMEFNELSTPDGLQLIETDGTTSISRGKTKEIIKNFISIRVGDTESHEAVRFYVYQEVTEPGIYEQHGRIVNATEETNGGTTPHWDNYTADELPMFYLDLDELDFNSSSEGESLKLWLKDDEDELADEGIIYESIAWEDDRDRINIAWLGDKYLAVGEDVTKLSKYLVDFESDEKLTLRQGETWDLGEGFTIYVQDVDIEGRKVWMVMEQDGSPIADIIAQDDEYGYYNETVAGESDVEVAVIHVDKVFAGMTANMAVIDDAEVISLDVIELDEDEYFGMEFNELSTPDGLQLIEKDGSTSISRGKTKELIKDFISIRVGDTESHEAVRYYVYNEVQVGEVVGPRPTAVETPTVTETETEVVPTEGVTGVPTATVTETETEVPTQKPTKEPGFTAVFAVAGLLAVAYLVLRKRE